MEIELGHITVPYSSEFIIDITQFGLEDEIVYTISNCSCLTLPKSVFVNQTKEIKFKINSKSDLVVFNEKKVYLYTSIGEIRNYFETIIFKYS